MLNNMNLRKKQDTGSRKKRHIQDEDTANRADSHNIAIPDVDDKRGGEDCNVTVMSGSSSKAFPVANQKVGDVRQLLKGVLNIADNAVALVNGDAVPEDHIVKIGDRLEFVRRAGHKGSSLPLS